MGDVLRDSKKLGVISLYKFFERDGIPALTGMHQGQVLVESAPHRGLHISSHHQFHRHLAMFGQTSALFRECVANPMDRSEVNWFGGFQLKFLPKFQNVVVNSPAARIVVIPPYLIQ